MAATPAVHEPRTPRPTSPLARVGVPLLLCLLLASSCWQLHVINRSMPLTQTDLLPRWAGTRLALQHQDPYSLPLLQNAQQPWSIRPQPFLYPATVVVLLAPLAPFSIQTAGAIFLAAVIPGLIFALWTAMRTLNLPLNRRDRVLVLAAAFSSWALLWGIRLEQPTLLVAALLFIAWFLLARGHQIAPGILLALATIKPQLVLPLFLWLLVWAIARRRWALIASFAASLALLLLATEKVVPGWLAHWRASLANYNATEHAARPLEHILGPTAGLTITVLLAIAAAFSLWRLRRCDANSQHFGMGLSLALAIALSLAPMQPLMIYNNLLLFPSLLLVVFRKPQGRLASTIRWLILLQLGADYALVLIAAAGESLSRAGTVWLSLPFLDFLLPVLLSAWLIPAILSSNRNIPAGISA